MVERFISGPDTLILSHHSLRYATFDERVAAAEAGGFDGMGLSLRAYRALRDEGRTDDDLLRVLDNHGQRLAELEALAGWAESGTRRDRAASDEELAHHIADVFGASYLQAIGPHEGTVDDAADAFSGVCDRAGEHGLVVGIEFLPFTNIPDVTSAVAIADRAGRANGGVCIDSWHFFRGTPDWEAFAAVPGARVVDVQFDDGPLVPEHPDYLEDCLVNRRSPGAGEFDLVRFVRTLDGIGSHAPISVEVISTELQALPAVEAAHLLATDTRRVLASARSS